ncbi:MULTISPECIES: hypothetical protein [unclassified Streptosporangium]|uniref:hypothetical protein n=1 Tax=unclassified Streptosporangium TaxID=2632669 RepID=UPI002E297241|nr:MULTISPECIES: hypothetical protein [unclassified Streptosporangium]
MLRRVLATAACAVLAGAAVLTLGSPAQAAAGPARSAASLVTVDLVFSPLYVGDYCRAKVNSAAYIGFYRNNSISCHGSGYLGQGDPYLACKYLTTDVVMSALPGPYEALLCRVIR